MRASRFRIRTLMLVILVAGLICGLIARQRAQEQWREAARLQLTSQCQETEAAYQKAWSEIGPHASEVRSISSTGATSTDRWMRTYKVGAIGDANGEASVSLEFVGRCSDAELKPIVITSHGGRLDAQVVEHLARAYRARRWRYAFTASLGHTNTTLTLPALK